MILSKIEEFYLNVLRVVILVAATIALIAFGIGITKVIPLISASLANHSTLDTSRAGLGDFVAAQKSSGTPAADMPEAASTPDEALSADMRSAIGHLSNYNTNRMGGTVDMASAQSALLSKRSTVSTDYQGDYDRSLNELMNQLDQSKGTPLDTDKLNSLINWHLEKFNALVAAKEAKKSEDKMTGLVGLGVAGTAMITFLLLVFCFLFVKIERNLRLVHVVERNP
jgi:hypothetical protein